MGSMSDYDFLRNRNKSSEYDFSTFENTSNLDNSIGNTTTRAKKSKGKITKENFTNRIVALSIACVIGAAGTGFVVGNEIVDRLKENAAVNIACYTFNQEAFENNIHRTDGNKYCFYDYDDIADIIMEDGKDFSSELFKLYHSVGEEQTNRVLEYTPHKSVEDYATQSGYEDVKDWAKAEKQKIVLAAEIAERKVELDAMYTDVADNSNVIGTQLGGSK